MLVDQRLAVPRQLWRRADGLGPDHLRVLRRLGRLLLLEDGSILTAGLPVDDDVHLDHGLDLDLLGDGSEHAVGLGTGDRSTVDAPHDRELGLPAGQALQDRAPLDDFREVISRDEDHAEIRGLDREVVAERRPDHPGWTAPAAAVFTSQQTAAPSTA